MNRKETYSGILVAIQNNRIARILHEKSLELDDEILSDHLET